MVTSKFFTWEELLRIDSPNTNYKAPSLKGNAEDHFFFSREAWSSLDDERYDALRQSFLLASKMLKVGNEYIATFLKPSSSVDIENINPSQGIRDYLDLETEDSYDQAIIRLKDPTKLDMMKSWIELGQISRSVTFQEHADLWPGMQCLATTIHGHLESDYDDEDGEHPLEMMLDAGPEETRDIDRKHLCQGLSRSKLTVLITRDFVDTILGTREEKDIAAELRTTFIAAVVLDFHNRWDIISGQPSVEGYNNLNLGDAFLGFIFGGWVPSVAIIQGDGRENRRFEEALQWKRVLGKDGGRPWFQTFYSISAKWLEKVLNEETWGAVQESETLPHSKTSLLMIRQSVLYPPAPFEEHNSLRGWSSIFVIGEGAIPKKKSQIDVGDFPYVDLDWKPDMENKALLDAQEKLRHSMIKRDDAIEGRDQAIRARDAALEQVGRLNQKEGSLQLVQEHSNAILAAEHSEGGRASLRLVEKYRQLMKKYKKARQFAQKANQERDEARAELAESREFAWP